MRTYKYTDHTGAVWSVTPELQRRLITIALRNSMLNHKDLGDITVDLMNGLLRQMEKEDKR